MANASAETVPFASATGLPTDTATDIVLGRVDANGTKTPTLEETTTVVVSGDNGTSALRGQEGTAQAHAAGVVAESLFTAKTWNDLIDGVLVEHGQDGKHTKVADHTIPAGSAELVDLSTAQSLSNKTLTAPAWDGWSAAGETWVYASADDPTYTFTIAGVDKTTKYYAGQRVKLTQSTGGVKYFIITKVAFSTDTTVTVYGGTDYNLENEAISSPFYSLMKAPAGFPLDPAKWTVEVKDATDTNSSTMGSWVNIGTTKIDLPIGVWNTLYEVLVENYVNGGTVLSNTTITLSTANNSEADKDWSANHYWSYSGAATVATVRFTFFRQKTINLASKATYYLNSLSASLGPVHFRGDLSTTILRAVCAYL